MTQQHDRRPLQEFGIFDRMEEWTEALGVETSVAPQVQGCMMHTEGRCFRHFKAAGDDRRQALEG